MYSQDACVRDILEEYLKEERNLEQKMKDCTEKHLKIKSDQNAETGAENPEGISRRIEYSESRIRNQRFLKDLEETKARLRTIASFTPTDQELRVLVGAYRGLLGNVGQSQPRSNCVE